MSANYQMVQWTPAKKVYDRWLVVGIALYLVAFVVVSMQLGGADEKLSAMVVLIRAFGSCAIVLLHLILIIGPLARLAPVLAPLLYNRRHMGVATALLALVHAALVTLFYHGFGTVNPFVSLLSGNTQYGSMTAFPFETLGLIALVVMLLLASTSHDFWQKTLGRDTWKYLHMMIYPAYALVVMHVALGALQDDPNIVYVLMLAGGVGIVCSLHLVAAVHENKMSRLQRPLENDGWLEVDEADQIKIGRAKIVTPASGEKIAVFRHQDGFNAVTNLCAHQGGPLGEGQIIDGCITCPWHGWQYKPGDGQSPPPFEEKIRTYTLKIEDGKLFVNVTPNKLGDSAAAVSL